MVGWKYFVILAALAPGRLCASEVKYGRDIQPILAENCYACHGPDKENRPANFRLDVREQALADRDGNPAIVPGHPEKSELVRRVFSDDLDERMPPPKSRHQLTIAQKNVLRQWIAEGAVWTKHWSLIPPERPAVPRTKEPAWVRNPIDNFILARLEQEGLRHVGRSRQGNAHPPRDLGLDRPLADAARDRRLPCRQIEQCLRESSLTGCFLPKHTANTAPDIGSTMPAMAIRRDFTLTPTRAAGPIATT